MPSLSTTTARNSSPSSRRFRWAAAVACLAQIAFLALGTAAPSFGGDPAHYWSAKNLRPTMLKNEWRLLGHRNWIVVADSAYPAQSRPGIQTVYAGQDHVKIVEEVLRAIDAAKHVRPVVYIDAESKFVSEKDAPGMEAYRKKLAGLLKKRPVKTMPHEEVIATLDEAAKTFRILILKTDMVLPYTTVFIQLDCGYWSAEKEKRLRKAMDAESK